MKSCSFSTLFLSLISYTLAFAAGSNKKNESPVRPLDTQEESLTQANVEDSAKNPLSAPKTPQYVESQIIIKFKSELKGQALKDAVQRLQKKYSLETLQTLESAAEPRLFLMKSLKHKTADLVEFLKSESDVSYAEPNFKMYMFQNQLAPKQPKIEDK